MNAFTDLISSCCRFLAMPKAKSSRTNAPKSTTPMSAEAYNAITQATIDEHLFRPKTAHGYAGYRKQIEAFWGKYLQEHPDHDQDDADALKRLTASTPKVLRYFTIKKCREDNKAFATAEGARSAFIAFAIEYALI